MDTAMIDAHLENIDRRLTNLEQILPTLATKDQLKALATKDELKALATKEELRLAIESLATKEELRLAIEPLATKQELQQGLDTLRKEIRDAARESRHYMMILDESRRDQIQLLAEQLLARMPNPPKE